MPFLDWVNKNQAKETTRQVPYHLLHQEATHGDVSGASADNRLALKALVPFYAGRVKCIFIDPPDTPNAGPEQVQALPSDVLAILQLDPEWMREHFPSNADFIDAS